MSHTRVLIAVAFAVVLAFAAIFLLRGSNGTGESQTPSLAFDPARAVELSVRYAGGRKSDPGRVERIVRTAGSTWNVHWSDDGESEGIWPAAPSQVRAALRILSTLELMPADRGSRVESPAADVRITLEDGSERRLVLSGRALAGRVLAEVGGEEMQAVWLDRSVMDMLVSGGGGALAGPRAWRDPSALPGVGSDVSRARLESRSAASLMLARVQGRWALREPVQEVAEPEVVGRLFTSLANVRVMDFLDDGVERPGQGAFVDNPAAVLILESEMRDHAAPGAPVAVLRRTLAVGTTADLAGRNVFARIRQEMQRGSETTIDFERTVIVSGELLAAVAMDPAAYIARQSFTMPPSDVGSAVIRMGDREHRYKRTLDGWRQETEEGARPLSREEAEGFAALLQLLLQAPAAHVVLREGTEGSIASVELTTISGNPLGEAVIIPAGEGLGIQSRGVLRLHDAQASQGVLRWMATK